MTIKIAAPTEKSNLDSASSEAFPTSQDANELSDDEFGFVTDLEARLEAPLFYPLEDEGSSTVPSYASESQAYKTSYTAETSPFAARQSYSNRPAATEPMEQDSNPSRGKPMHAIPGVPLQGKSFNTIEESQMDAYFSEFAAPDVTTNTNVYKSSRTKPNFLRPFAVDGTHSFAVPRGNGRASVPPKRCFLRKRWGNVVIPCLFWSTCAGIVAALVFYLTFPWLSQSSPTMSPSSSPLYFAEYKLNWQVEITNGTFDPSSFNHALEISCHSGGIVSDAQVTSYVVGVSPTCDLLDSSLSCKQPSSAPIDTDGNVLNALFSFTCSGNSREELEAYATMAAQYIDVTANAAASHFIYLCILDSKGSCDSSDSRCSENHWMLAPGSTIWLCKATSTCYDETCTLELRSLTIFQGAVDYSFVQSI